MCLQEYGTKFNSIVCFLKGSFWQVQGKNNNSKRTVRLRYTGSLNYTPTAMPIFVFKWKLASITFYLALAGYLVAAEVRSKFTERRGNCWIQIKNHWDKKCIWCSDIRGAYEFLSSFNCKGRREISPPTHPDTYKTKEQKLSSRSNHDYLQIQWTH